MLLQLEEDQVASPWLGEIAAGKLQSPRRRCHWGARGHLRSVWLNYQTYSMED